MRNVELTNDEADALKRLVEAHDGKLTPNFSRIEHHLLDRVAIKLEMAAEAEEKRKSASKLSLEERKREACLYCTLTEFQHTEVCPLRYVAQDSQ